MEDEDEEKEDEDKNDQEDEEKNEEGARWDAHDPLQNSMIESIPCLNPARNMSAKEPTQLS